ncbi:cytochrome D1 domain-containing protein [Magnetovibrio sp.]|uniref:cytochrome D1 domain-containing protein n=1 Tax=Magnetovibrio sp. TaxID=2024836 RepID=UPI002F951AE8
MTKKKWALLALVTAGVMSGVPAAAEDTESLFKTHCSECHGLNRLGGIGPALLPENLSRLRKKSAVQVIKSGRPATQMQGFGEVLNDEQIAALADFIYQPPAAPPTWTMADISASHIIHTPLSALPDKPLHKADPLNLFTVVETGDHHVTILDGDAFEPLWRFPSRYALHGGAKYSPDGRFMYLGSRDGWVSKYDLHSFQIVAEIRAGINMRNIAVSADGRYVMAANYLPHTLTLLNASDLSPIKSFDVLGKDGTSSRVSAVYTAPPRNSFVVALKDIPEIWEIEYSDNPRPVAKGMVHNWTPGQEEGDFDYGPFPVRRIVLNDYLDDFFFDQSYEHVVGAARDGKSGQVVNLDVSRKIATIDLAGMPHLGSGITFEYQGRPVLATPHLKGGTVSVIDMQSWKTIKKIETLGPGFFMRSHDNTPYAWVDVFFGPDKDALHVIDKRTLDIVKTIRPEPGKTGAHVEFDRDGKHALVSVWEMDGALVVYDAATLEEVKRIPMKKPVGKYNVYNKITYSAGTSH